MIVLVAMFHPALLASACPDGTGGAPNAGTSVGLELAQLEAHYQPLISAALAGALETCTAQDRSCDATDFFESDSLYDQYLAAMVQVLAGQYATIDVEGPSVGIPRAAGVWTYHSESQANVGPEGWRPGYQVAGTEWPRYVQCSSPWQFEYDLVLSNIKLPNNDVAYFSNLSAAPLAVSGGANYLVERLSHVQHAGGSTMVLTYDDRGNIIEKKLLASDGSQYVSTTAHYPITCSNRLTCNQPDWVQDPKRNQTDYEYHPLSGRVSKITGPADGNAVRPQVRYFYEQRNAWLKASNGGYVPSDASIWLLTQEEYCRTSSASGDGCSAGAADEVVTTYDYGPNSGPNNLWLRGKTVTSEGVSLRTCYTYDVFGNQLTETTPNANLASCP